MSSKCGQKLLDTTKILAINALKTVSKKVIQKTPEATTYLVGNKIAEKNLKATSKSPKKSSQPTEMPKEINIPPEKHPQIINELQLL